MMATCPECGKEFCVLYPTLYAYRRKRYPDTYYFCTYSCMRAYDRKEEATMPAKRIRLTEEQTAEAVKKYYSGGRKAALEYLSSIGSKAPAPLFESLRKRLKLTKCNIVPEIPEAVEPVPEQEEVTGQIVIKTSEDTFDATKLTGLKGSITGFRTDCGEYRISNNGFMYFGSSDNDELEMPIEFWAKFSRELPQVMHLLGVCFDGGTD